MSIGRLFLTTLVLFLITGCTPFKTFSIAEQLSPNTKEQPAYLIGSFGVNTEGDDNAPYGVFGLIFSPKGGNENGYLRYLSSNKIQYLSPIEYETSQNQGRTFVVALRPGEYELHSAIVNQIDSIIKHSFSAKRSYSLPFTLKAGRALYIGEFIAYGKWSRNKILDNPIGIYFVRSDNIERDKSIILATHPELKELPIDFLPITKDAPPLVFIRDTSVDPFSIPMLLPVPIPLVK
jgi:hypothetical protein